MRVEGAGGVVLGVDGQRADTRDAGRLRGKVSRSGASAYAASLTTRV
jgi:hypothetical protein